MLSFKNLHLKVIHKIIYIIYIYYIEIVCLLMDCYHVLLFVIIHEQHHFHPLFVIIIILYDTYHYYELKYSLLLNDLLQLGSDASFTLQGEMVNYTNPFHSTANGECCHVHQDVARPPNCNQQCDNVFVFCWKAYGSTSTSIAEKACISRISTSIIASSDNFTFPIGNLLSANVPPPRNPLILKGATWRVSSFISKLTKMFPNFLLSIF